MFSTEPVPGGTYSASAVIPVTELQIGDQAQSLPAGGLAIGPLALALAGPCPRDPVIAAPGQVEVGFVAGTTDAQAEQRLPGWGTVASFDSTLRFALLNLKPGECIVDAVAAIKSLAGVASVQPNGLVCGTWKHGHSLRRAGFAAPARYFSAAAFDVATAGRPGHPSTPHLRLQPANCC